MQTRREKSRLGRPLCACSGSGVFIGYASLFGERDQSGDVVMPGAFAGSLKKRAARDVRMLFQHDAAEPVGTWIDMRETARGLHVTGRLDRNVQRAREIEQWIAEEVQQAFAEQEGVAFVTGNGVNRPKGFLDYPRVADASWSWGNIGFVLSGAAAAFPTANPSDRLFDLAYALRAAYRQNASWVMNRRTQNTIRKFRDSTGNYLWEPAIRPDGRATLMGFPITESEAMPDIAADSAAIAFGDFGQGYLVVDRLGVRVLRDPYSAKPYVLFYTTKRVGGGVQNFEAIKLMRFAAT